MVFVLEEKNSIASQFLGELRDKEIQKDRLRFRTNVERIGNIMAYEISKNFNYQSKTVSSPLASLNVNVLKEQPILIAILRAGIPYFNGFQQFFDRADCGFIGAYRKEGRETLKIKLDYLATPSLQDRDVILIDPMLATGSSIAEACQALRASGTPRHIFIACIVASRDGLDYLQRNLTIPHSVWCASVDEKLNKQLYIVPGLGDAGDLSFGEKI